jgi:serine/threonine-protein kinase
MLDGMISVGSVVAGYSIEAVLGAGGMGTVFLAKNPALPRRDALKVLSAEMSGDRAFRERFIREADIVSQVDHPNIVSIYSRGETADGQLWIALQYVEGTDAEAALRAGSMTPQRAIRIVTEVAKALDYAHQRNVVHHDVKPANLLLSGESGDSERVFLSDFGVARPIDDTDRSMDGAFTATLAYSAPEVITGAQIDGRADLYSLGCTLFRLLTGKQPYQADGLVGTIRAHLQQAQPRVSDHLSWATPELDAVIAKALAKDPAQRFGSAREFAAAAAVAMRQAAPPAGVTAPYRARASGPEPAARRTAPAIPSVQPPVRPTPSGPPRPMAARAQQFGEMTDFRASIKTGPKVPRPVAVLWGVAAVLIAVAAVLITVLVRRDPAPPTATPTSPTTPSATADAQAQARLMRLLPAGYPAGSCDPGSIPAGARAVMSCEANADAGGPTSGTYTLAESAAALRSAFDEVVSRSTTVVCPGNIQSPGPWRRNANPAAAAGTLYCGTDGGKAVIAWTTDSELLLNVVQADGRAMDGLYRWWSTHS